MGSHSGSPQRVQALLGPLKGPIKGPNLRNFLRNLTKINKINFKKFDFLVKISMFGLIGLKLKDLNG